MKQRWEAEKSAIAALRADGIRVVMLTGDNRTTAEAVARRLGIDEVAADVLPEQKSAVVERLRREGRVVAMAGDGVNDAPALAAMARAAGLGTTIETAADPHAALNAASRDRGAVIVAGSLYLVGAVRERLLREGKLPDDGSLDRLATTGSVESQG